MRHPIDGCPIVLECRRHAQCHRCYGRLGRPDGGV
jgi:hypothetical protein